MERKIGEIFEYNGEWYQCVEGNCAYCSLEDEACEQRIINDVCKLNRIFKKLEKVGKPYYSGVHYVQDYKVRTPANYNGIYPLSFGIYGKENIVTIKNKQNQEDMEDNKLNLKPFDIQKAREGKPVCTRDGRKARIICFDRNDLYPIVALIECEDGKEIIGAYSKEGQTEIYEIKGTDLMMLPEKKEGWVNVYCADTTFYFVEGMVYDTKEEAIKHINPDNEIYTTTAKIEFEK